MSNRKAPVRFAVDFVNEQISGTATSLNKAKRYGSDEYIELCKLKKAHPSFKVVEKAIKRQANKHTYKDLSFAFIEEYISIQGDDEIHNEYERVKQIAATLNTNVYSYTKSWFLKKFSNGDKPFDVDKAREEINTYNPAVTQAQATM